MTPGPGVLLVLDGWGHAEAGPSNAIAAASTPVLDALLAREPNTLLNASGTAVGLPEGTVGNSEIGHLVIGAGRALEYDSLLVERQVRSGALSENPLLTAVCAELAGSGNALHIMGLCSDGRIHADIGHVPALLLAAAKAGLTKVWLHAITDGRDVPNETAAAYVSRLRELATEAGAGRLATVIGRNYALDKAGDLSLTAVACDLLLDGRGTPAEDLIAAVRSTTTTDDGWIEPITQAGNDGVRDGDVILFANFRSDRTVQLVELAARRLKESGRKHTRLLSLAQYDTSVDVPALVPRSDASGGLADVLQNAGVRSVRVAEREKFEHVTFYVNGRDPRQRPYEEPICVPSGAGGDYVGRPQMNVSAVVDAVNAASRRSDVGLVIANLANIDVIGHTGDFHATVKAAEAVDTAVGQIAQAAAECGRWLLAVGDHGNGEVMAKQKPDGEWQAYGGHTTNPVPVVLAGVAGVRLSPLPGSGGHGLPSVATTAISLLGLEPLAPMTAPTLISR